MTDRRGTDEPRIDAVDHPPSPLLTAQEAAQYLRMSSQALQRLRWHGTGPSYVRHGAYVRYYQTDLDAWLDRLLAPAEIKASDRDQPHSRKAARS